MENANFYNFFAAEFPRAGNKPFLIMPGRDSLMYRDIDSRTAQLQNHLQILGVSPGDRVIVQVEKSIENILLYMACLRAGAIFIPLNTAYTANEVEYFVQDAKPALLVVMPSSLDKLTELGRRNDVPQILSLGENGEGTFLEGVETLSDQAEVVSRDADDLAAILYTSGTTGRSKGAMLSHDNLQSNAIALHDYWQWDDANDVLLHALPVFHVHGLFVALHCALLGASPVHFLAKFSVQAIVEKLPESTVMMGVPTFYTRLLDYDGFNAEVCKNMRLFTAGSAPLLAETHKQFEERTGHRILERYGMTEAGMITSNPYHGERIAGTVGFALPKVKVRVADDNGNILPVGETGVLEVTGPNVFKGYWQMPEKTAAEFREDGWFITGDLSVMDTDGRVTIVGRAKDLIISGGYNVYPKEIESVIDDIPGVKESAVIGVPHNDFGEAVTAVVVADGSHELSEQIIRDNISDKLAKFKQPKKVWFVDSLPRNTMGKVQKAELRKTYEGAFN